jgi:hypothetical protein
MFGEPISTCCTRRQEPTGNHRKKFEKFPIGILLPQNHWNYVEPVVSGPGCPTWVMQIIDDLLFDPDLMRIIDGH